MSTVKLTIGRLQRDVLVTAPGLLAGHVKIRIPEFYAKTQARTFAVEQVLNWHSAPHNGSLLFNLDVSPDEIGIDYHGSASIKEHDDVDLRVTLANHQGEDMLGAHHTIHLDTSTLAGFDDPQSERTFVYTDAGWKTLASLVPATGSPSPSARVGASYHNYTIIWKVVALLNEEQNMAIGFALYRAYAFANNHPQWPKGLLIGCRWGTLYKDEELSAHGKLYLCRQGLPELEQLYVRDFK